MKSYRIPTVESIEAYIANFSKQNSRQYIVRFYQQELEKIEKYRQKMLTDNRNPDYVQARVLDWRYLLGDVLERTATMLDERNATRSDKN